MYLTPPTCVTIATIVRNSANNVVLLAMGCLS